VTTPTLAEILAPATFAETKAALKADFDALLVAQGRAPVTADWEAGNALDNVFDVAALHFAEAEDLAAQLALGQSRTLSDGDLTKALAADVYGVPPVEPYAASGDVEVFADGAGFEVLAGVDRFRNPSSGVLYTATANVTIPAAGSALVPVVAPAVGATYTTALGTVTEVVISRAGARCSNPAALVGSDGESNASLKRRMALAPIARQGMPTDAKWEFEARNVGVHGVPVTRVGVEYDGPSVRLIVATAAGALTPTQATALDAYLIQTVGSGGFSVVSATERPLATSLRIVTLWLPRGTGGRDADLILRAANLLEEVLAACPIGGEKLGSWRGFPAEQARGRILRELGLSNVENFPGDITMTTGREVPVPGAITFIVRRAS